MLRAIKELTGYTLDAEDGEIGRCKDFLFDDEKWVVRYMVADTGRWLAERRVLISPISFDEPNWADRRIPVRLTKSQIRESPPVDTHAPISRRYEQHWHTYYGWPTYWGGPGLWGTVATPGELYRRPLPGPRDPVEASQDSYLRSFREICGYRIQATDGELGHVEDLIAEDSNWAVRYAVVDTRNWLPGRKVLVALGWISDVSWKGQHVVVEMNRQQIKDSPKFDPAAPVNRRYEARLYDYYGRPRYWAE